MVNFLLMIQIKVRPGLDPDKGKAWVTFSRKYFGIYILSTIRVFYIKAMKYIITVNCKYLKKTKLNKVKTQGNLNFFRTFSRKPELGHYIAADMA